MAERKKRRITAKDLYRFQLITDLQISPDGRFVVYTLQWVDPKTEKKYINLWISPTAGGRSRQFTYGDHIDTAPRWSPDGQEIAFLSNRGDKKQAQIYLIHLSGGEARQLTDLKGDINGFEWSPDGKRLLLEFRKKDAETIEREQDEQKKELGVVARHVTRVFFKYDDEVKRDGEGYLPKERSHIWAVDVRSGRARQLTYHAVFDEWSPRWSPDGKSIVFLSNRSPDPDLDPDAVDLYVIPASGGEIRWIPTPFGPKATPSYSPDGRWLAYLGYEGRGDWWKNTCVWVVPADSATEGQARNLTGRYDINAASYTLCDISMAGMAPPTWSSDGKCIFFQADLRGNTPLLSISHDGEDLQTVVGGEGAVGAYSFDRQQRSLAYFWGEVGDPCQIRLHDMGNGRVRRLSSHNQGWLRRVALGQVEEVWFKGSDGYDLQGWILKPSDFNPRERYPAILEIHGGPLAQYGHVFMHEFYYLAANGYVVFYSNPRGGQGYGEQHARAIWNAWGTVDYDDLMAWTDTVASLPYIDAERLGVTGGSYGGYMTNWIIGHTQRFKAAVTQRSVSNLISMWGSSDVNWVFQEEFGDQMPPWENFDRYWEMSPMKYIGSARTPTLVIHSENDRRCAIEQGEQVFVALKKMGVEAEMVRFPGEPHGLSRGGRTDRRVVRLNHILRWFDKYLK